MADITVRKQRLRTLENEIREDYEAFYHVGMKLKEIRDDQLYKEDGFETWKDYCRERWDWSSDHAARLITAAEYRKGLPKPSVIPPSGKDNGQNESAKGHEWSERSVRELTRIDDKRDAEKVAAKVVKAVEQSQKAAAKDPEVEPLKLTASTVRKFVDAELGVNRAAQAKETKRRREEEELPDFLQFLVDLTGQIEAETEKLVTVADESWKLFRADNPNVVKRLIAACDALTGLLRRVEE